MLPVIAATVVILIIISVITKESFYYTAAMIVAAVTLCTIITTQAASFSTAIRAERLQVLYNEYCKAGIKPDYLLPEITEINTKLALYKKYNKIFDTWVNDKVESFIKVKPCKNWSSSSSSLPYYPGVPLSTHP